MLNSTVKLFVEVVIPGLFGELVLNVIVQLQGVLAIRDFVILTLVIHGFFFLEMKLLASKLLSFNTIFEAGSLLVVYNIYVLFYRVSQDKWTI